MSTQAQGEHGISLQLNIARWDRGCPCPRPTQHYRPETGITHSPQERIKWTLREGGTARHPPGPAACPILGARPFYRPSGLCMLVSCGYKRSQFGWCLEIVSRRSHLQTAYSIKVMKSTNERIYKLQFPTQGYSLPSIIIILNFVFTAGSHLLISNPSLFYNSSLSSSSTISSSLRLVQRRTLVPQLETAKQTLRHHLKMAKQGPGPRPETQRHPAKPASKSKDQQRWPHWASPSATWWRRTRH